MTIEEYKLITSEQYKQWHQLGLAEFFEDEGEMLFWWTPKGRTTTNYRELKEVECFVKGRYITDKTREKMEIL